MKNDKKLNNNNNNNKYTLYNNSIKISFFILIFY